MPKHRSTMVRWSCGRCRGRSRPSQCTRRKPRSSGSSRGRGAVHGSTSRRNRESSGSGLSWTGTAGRGGPKVSGSVAQVDRGAWRAGWSFLLEPQMTLARSVNTTASRRPVGSSVCDLVVSAAQVLHERVAGGEDPQPGHGLDPAHRAQPAFQKPANAEREATGRTVRRVGRMPPKPANAPWLGSMQQTRRARSRAHAL
jgi:hypothetical protein